MWRSWFDCRWSCWNFLFTYSFRPHYGTGVDSASNTNEYQQYFLREERGVKGGRCVGLTTFLYSYADCFEICELQTPGTLGACKGIFTLNIPILACSILFEVQTDSFHIHNVDELVLRKVSFITGCPMKSNKNFMQNLVFNVEYGFIFIR